MIYTSYTLNTEILDSIHDFIFIIHTSFSIQILNFPPLLLYELYCKNVNLQYSDPDALLHLVFWSCPTKAIRCLLACAGDSMEYNTPQKQCSCIVCRIIPLATNQDNRTMTIIVSWGAKGCNYYQYDAFTVRSICLCPRPRPSIALQCRIVA